MNMSGNSQGLISLLIKKIQAAKEKTTGSFRKTQGITGGQSARIVTYADFDKLIYLILNFEIFYDYFSF